MTHATTDKKYIHVPLTTHEIADIIGAITVACAVAVREKDPNETQAYATLVSVLERFLV